MMHTLLLTISLLTAKPATPAEPVNNIASQQNTVLWGVVNKKGDTSYLLGTSHDFGNTFVDNYPLIKIKFKKADIVAFEATGDQRQAFKHNRKWTKYLTRKEKRATNLLFSKLEVGFKVKHVKRVPPQFVNYSLLTALYIERCKSMTPEDVVGMDEYLANGAITFKKRVAGLESVEDTFGVVNSMLGLNNNTDSSGLGTLKEIVSNTAQFYPSIDSQCGEAAKYRNLQLDYKFDTKSTEIDSLYTILLDKRNNSWMQQIEAIIDTSHSAFIAVGLYHLYYTDGLIMQLTRKGYRVFPMTLVRKEDFHERHSH
jgi:uncharacterized protein